MIFNITLAFKPLFYFFYCLIRRYKIKGNHDLIDYTTHKTVLPLRIQLGNRNHSRYLKEKEFNVGNWLYR